jgi:hypothetical protein
LSPDDLEESGFIQAFKYLNQDELANEWERWKFPSPKKLHFMTSFKKECEHALLNVA